MFYFDLMVTAIYLDTIIIPSPHTCPFWKVNNIHKSNCKRNEVTDGDWTENFKYGYLKQSFSFYYKNVNKSTLPSNTIVQ